MDTCIHCGAESWRKLSESPILIVELCGGCGRERTILTTPVEGPVFEGKLEPVFSVLAHWPQPPSSDDIHELMAHFWLMPESEESIRRKVANHEKIELGRFNDSEMKSHEDLLKKLNLVVQRFPLPETQGAGASDRFP